jgi:pentatricopeptide repeat protein
MQPYGSVYNHLLNALHKEAKFSMISPLYTDMKRDGIEPNVYMYNILIMALCKNNCVEAAQKLLEEIPNKALCMIW